MLYSAQQVRENIRNREGKRVFYLGKTDQLTSEARDYLTRERVEILPAEKARPERWRLETGGYLDYKPEHMTHLNGDTLVSKTHPRIAFRGAVDTLEAEIILCQLKLPHLSGPLGELLSLSRSLIRCDVLEETLPETTLGGLTQQQLREHSHRPQDFYGQPHFMPSAADGEGVAFLNRLRCCVRSVELKAVAALPDRGDILQGLNRMSSFVYILMIREKANRESKE